MLGGALPVRGIALVGAQSLRGVDAGRLECGD